jgi:hypothetical protein
MKGVCAKCGTGMIKAMPKKTVAIVAPVKMKAKAAKKIRKAC